MSLLMTVEAWTRLFWATELAAAMCRPKANYGSASPSTLHTARYRMRTPAEIGTEGSARVVRRDHQLLHLCYQVSPQISFQVREEYGYRRSPVVTKNFIEYQKPSWRSAGERLLSLNEQMAEQSFDQ